MIYFFLIYKLCRNGKEKNRIDSHKITRNKNKYSGFINKFNFEAGFTNDALSIRNDDGTPAIVPEWKKYSRSVGKFAYIKGQSNRKIQVRFDSNCQSMHLLIKTTIVDGNGIGNICNFFVENYNKLDYVTLPLECDIPNCVETRSFTWNWEIYAIPVDAGYCSYMSNFNTDQICYTLFDQPKFPMSEPWIGVLDHACEWATGQLQDSLVVQKVAKGLYNSPEFKYDIIRGSPQYTGSTTQVFNLKQMLLDFGETNILVNCYDMGKAVHIFSNALGCNTDYKFCNNFGYLNCIKAIGRDWSNNPFYINLPSPDNQAIVGEDFIYPHRTMFDNHAFCMLRNTVFDACLKVDIDDNPDALPINNESFATEWNWTTYKSKVVDDNPVSFTSVPIKYVFDVK